MRSIRGMRRHSASGRPRRHVSFFDIGYEPTTLPTRPSNPLTSRQGRFGGWKSVPAARADRPLSGQLADLCQTAEGDAPKPDIPPDVKPGTIHSGRSISESLTSYRDGRAFGYRLTNTTVLLSAQGRACSSRQTLQLLRSREYCSAAGAFYVFCCWIMRRLRAAGHNASCSEMPVTTRD